MTLMYLQRKFRPITDPPSRCPRPFYDSTYYVTILQLTSPINTSPIILENFFSLRVHLKCYIRVGNKFEGSKAEANFLYLQNNYSLKLNSERYEKIRINKEMESTKVYSGVKSKGIKLQGAAHQTKKKDRCLKSVTGLGQGTQSDPLTHIRLKHFFMLISVVRGY